MLLLVAVVCGLYGHLLGAANMARGRAFVVALAVPLLLGGSSYLVLSRIQARNVNHIETDIQVFPPGWLLRRGGTVDRYFEEAARLRGESDARRSAIPVDEAEAD